MFSTQGLKYPGVPSLSDEPGKMYILDLLHPKPTPVELQIKGGLDLRSFNPHGISVYIDEAGEVQIRCNISATEQRKERVCAWCDHKCDEESNIVKTSKWRIRHISLVLVNSYEVNEVNITSYCCLKELQRVPTIQIFHHLDTNLYNITTVKPDTKCIFIQYQVMWQVTVWIV